MAVGSEKDFENLFTLSRFLETLPLQVFEKDFLLSFHSFRSQLPVGNVFGDP